MALTLRLHPVVQRAVIGVSEYVRSGHRCNSSSRQEMGEEYPPQGRLNVIQGLSRSSESKALCVFILATLLVKTGLGHSKQDIYFLM